MTGQGLDSWLAGCFRNTCSKLEWKIIEIISLIGSRYIFVFRWRFSGMERGGGGCGGGSCIMLLMFVRLCMCVCAGMLLLLHEIKQFEQGPGPTSRQIPVDRRFVQHSIGAPESGDEEIVIRSNYVIFLSYLDTNVLHQTHAHTHTLAYLKTRCCCCCWWWWSAALKFFFSRSPICIVLCVEGRRTALFWRFHYGQFRENKYLLYTEGLKR